MTNEQIAEALAACERQLCGSHHSDSYWADVWKIVNTLPDALADLQEAKARIAELESDLEWSDLKRSQAEDAVIEQENEMRRMVKNP
jgi:hypothetical protein